MKAISILDCTLRDGGCVNEFNFGTENIKNLLEAQEEANIDIIECGYIDEENGAQAGKTKFCDELVIRDNFLRTKKRGIEYVAMIDYGKYDVHNLSIRTQDGIDGIRLAFHKENINAAIKNAKTILSKGYNLYIQPMVTMRYADDEILSLIGKVNREIPDTKAFYIVDSFGEMRADDVSRIFSLVDHNLNMNISIGFHSHNNLQLSYSNAVSILHSSLRPKRSLIFDASIMGMGKGAGNLNTEIFAEHLNKYYGGNYKIEPLMRVVDNILLRIYEEFRWGYSVEYFLSSICGCTPSYANYFYSKHIMSVEQLKEIMQNILPEKKYSFDKTYAEKLYAEFNARKDLEEDDFAALKKEIECKEVIIIAPGKSVIQSLDEIRAILCNDNCVAMSLNDPMLYDTEYALVTKSDVRRDKNTNDFRGKRIIRTSNVDTYKAEEYVLDYHKWTNNDGESGDAAIVIALNLLDKIGVKRVYLAGVDGFSENLNDNYYEDSLKRKMTSLQVRERNDYIGTFLKKKSERMIITFITKSLFNKD